MDSFLSVDFNIFTVIFLLLIFWGLEMKLSRIQKKIDEIDKKIK